MSTQIQLSKNQAFKPIQEITCREVKANSREVTWQGKKEMN